MTAPTTTGHRPAYLVALLLACGLLLPAQASEWLYRVRQGENLWTITRAHLTDLRWLQPLQRLNGVRDPEVLVPGEELRVPLAWTRRRSAQARLDNVQGKVEIVRADGTAPAATGGSLRVGDALRTGRDGIATLRYPDGSVTRVFPGSLVRVDELEMLGDSAQMMARIDLQQGRSENIVRPGSVVRRSRVQVSTPYSTTSVRGTHFRVEAAPDAQRAYTGVLHGAVDVAGTQSVRGRQVRVATGFGAQVDAGAGAPARRRLLDAPNVDGVDALLQEQPFRIALAPVAGATSYRGELASDAEFDHIVAATTAETPTLVFTDVPDGAYWLRASAVDAGGLQGADARKRIALDARPEPPFLMQPAPTATVTAGEVQFAWAGRKEAAQYVIEIVRADAQGQPVGEPVHRIRTAETKASRALTADTPQAYLWRAQVTDARGDVGPFGAYAAFTVVPPGPSAQPPSVSAKNLTLGWGAQRGIQRWKVQLARDAAFTDIVHDLATDTPMVTIPRPKAGDYAVRIAWVDAQGMQGPWGDTQTVTVPRKPPYWLGVPLMVWLLTL